jgi:beta-phosphoglucomutase-like phosphatase (HAD superfamily)
VSGREAAALHLAGKPAPDTYIKAMELLDARPEGSVVFEDSVTGVQAANTAGVGLIVGIDRADDRSALLWRGANVVVDDLCELEGI